jgi:NitT/TauT family transport system permease protein
MGPIRRAAGQRRTLHYLTAMVEPLSLLSGALMWEILARALDYRFFPPLTEVLADTWTLLISDRFVQNLSSTLANLAIGLSFSIVVGVLVGLLMGVYERVHHALDIYVNAFVAAPSLVFAPIFFTLFGLSRWSVVAVVVSYALFVIIISTEGAVRNVDQNLLEMSRSFAASPWVRFRRVILPGALPVIMAGLRGGGGLAVKGMINGEMFIAVTGLGALLMSAGRRFDTTSVLSLILVILVVALVVDKVLQLLDARVNSWMPSRQ